MYTVQSLDAQLFGKRLQYWRGRCHWVFQEGAQIAHGSELYGVTEPVMHASFAGNQRMISIVQVKVAGQVARRWHARIAAVVLALFAGKKADGHRAFLPIRSWRDGAPRSA